MTPERIKAIRKALRRSDGRKPTQKELAAFLRMGDVSIARYEAGANIPCNSNALLLEVMTDRHTVERIARLNKRDGIFSDIRLAQQCWECESHNTITRTIEQRERGRGNVPPFAWQRGLITCQDCGAAWYDQEWRESLAMSGFKAAWGKKKPAEILLRQYQMKGEV